MEKLGIQPSLLVAQLVNFTIIVVTLNVLLYKPIISMLDKRKKEIEEGLALTEKMKTEEEKMEEKKKGLLDKGRVDATAVVEEAKNQAKEEVERIIAEAHVQAEEIVAKAKQQTEKEREAMEKDVQKQSIEIAIAMAKKLLANVLTKDMQKSIFDKQLQALVTDK